MKFTDIPYFSKLFRDYTENFPELENLYNGNYSNTGDYIKIIREKIKSKHLNINSRNIISDILKNQNKFFNSGNKTFDNIELLKRENTFAVITGQQVGILSGSIYTIYKIITALKLTEQLNLSIPDYHFVPIFWMECDDHDFLEINNINIIDQHNSLKNLNYNYAYKSDDKFLTPVYKMEIDEDITNFIEELKSSLSNTDFTETIFDYINRSYKAGINFETSFARFINYLFKDRGLILCNPTDKNFKKLLISVFLKELNTYPKTCECVIESSLNLENKYEPQIKPKPINVFYNFDNKRYLIEPIDKNSFGLKNTRKKILKEEIFDDLETNPDNFSPNVVLRPICQDFLFPTVCYIGGPSEIAYFGQLKKVYEYYDIAMPILYPRVSLTLLENKILSFIDKYNIKAEELFNVRALSNSLLEKLEDVKIDTIFSKFTDEINSNLYELEVTLNSIDKNIFSNFKTKTDKYLEIVNLFKNKFIDSQIKQNDIIVKKSAAIVETIFPNNIPQERVHNIVYYLNKYGLDFINYLETKVKINIFEHQIVDINFKN
jgi:bacillithiol synthase